MQEHRQLVEPIREARELMISALSSNVHATQYRREFSFELPFLFYLLLLHIKIKDKSVLKDDSYEKEFPLTVPVHTDFLLRRLQRYGW